MEIIASATSNEHDFDFLVGKWQVKNRKLVARLSNCTDWITFDSEIHMVKTLNGFGNMERYFATFDNQPFEGMAIRLFNPETKLWKVYWTDTSSCKMDEHPVTGSFENGIGKFYAADFFNGIPIVVLYQWDASNKQFPKWSQAFSVDNGLTWEWNWEMQLEKLE